MDQLLITAGHSSPSTLTVEISRTDITGQKLDEVWWTYFKSFAGILASYLDTYELPVALVHYGREYGQESYYDHVGEFLDLIPILVHADFTQEDLLQYLDFTKRHSINFMALTDDSVMISPYSNVQKQLAAAYRQTGQEPRKLILFNFQGFISSEETIPELEQVNMTDSEPSLACMEWVIRYDENCVYVHLGCHAGLDIEQLKQLMEKQIGSDGNIKVQVHNEAVEVQHVQ
jgi:hypothetical protein